MTTPTIKKLLNASQTIHRLKLPRTHSYQEFCALPLKLLASGSHLRTALSSVLEQAFPRQQAWITHRKAYSHRTSLLLRNEDCQHFTACLATKGGDPRKTVGVITLPT